MFLVEGISGSRIAYFSHPHSSVTFFLKRKKRHKLFLIHFEPRRGTSSINSQRHDFWIKVSLSLSFSLCLYIFTYMYVYMHVCVHVCLVLCVYIEWELDRDRKIWLQIMRPRSVFVSGICVFPFLLWKFRFSEVVELSCSNSDVDFRDLVLRITIVPGVHFLYFVWLIGSLLIFVWFVDFFFLDL